MQFTKGRAQSRLFFVAFIGKSLNDVAIEALARGTGISGEATQQRDLSDIAGKWREDPIFDRAVSDQDVIDGELWR